MTWPAATDTSSMRELVRLTSEPDAGRSLNPNRMSIWPVERGGYGIEFTYHGATGYTDAETAEQMLQDATAWHVPGPRSGRPQHAGSRR